MKYLISVITVVYNDSIGLRVTADSIANQDLHSTEWIVIDGNSKDGTVSIIKEYSFCITKSLSENDNGIYDAMNKGVKLSEGKFIVFLNAGDRFLDRNALSKVREHLKFSNDKPDLLFGGANYQFTNGKKIYRPPKEMKKYIWHGLPAIHQATFFKKSKMPSPPYDLRYEICGDYYITSKMYLSGCRATYLNTPIVDFMVGGTSYRNPFKMIKETYQIQSKILKRSLASRLLSATRRYIASIATIIIQNFNR